MEIYKYLIQLASTSSIQFTYQNLMAHIKLQPKRKDNNEQQGQTSWKTQ